MSVCLWRVIYISIWILRTERDGCLFQIWGALPSIYIYIAPCYKKKKSQNNLRWSYSKRLEVVLCSNHVHIFFFFFRLWFWSTNPLYVQVTVVSYTFILVQKRLPLRWVTAKGQVKKIELICRNVYLDLVNICYVLTALTWMFDCKNVLNLDSFAVRLFRGHHKFKALSSECYKVKITSMFNFQIFRH